MCYYYLDFSEPLADNMYFPASISNEQGYGYGYGYCNVHSCKAWH